MRNAATTGKRVGYGWLYNWYAVDHTSGLAPDGWRVPTTDEVIEMRDYLVANYTGVTNLNAGGYLKSTRNEWYSPNEGANNEFGFELLPSGYRYDSGVFDRINENGYIYTQSSVFTDSKWNGWWWRTYKTTAGFDQGYGDKAEGYSVRCIQDKSVGQSDGDTGILEDYDGNIYTYVVIGDYRWMAENLRTTKYKDGTSIPEITDDTSWAADTTGARCAYDNDHYYVYPPLK